MRVWDARHPNSGTDRTLVRHYTDRNARNIPLSVYLHTNGIVPPIGKQRRSEKNPSRVGAQFRDPAEIGPNVPHSPKMLLSPCLDSAISLASVIRM